MDNLKDKQMLEAVIKTSRVTRMLAMKAYLLSGAMKTEDAYRRSAWRIIRELYSGEIDEYAFVDDFAALIDGQFTRAWNQGARDVGVDPRQFTDADITELANRISAERDYMLQLADDIMAAREKQSGVEQFRARADMYAARYNDLVNQAHVWFGGKKLLEWVLGPTEDHCHTNGSTHGCAELAGTVATADDWKASGIRPQSSSTTCGGYHCQCSLVPTDKPPSGKIPK